MSKIVCPISYIPVRSETTHQSEQVTQLLFGETAIIKEHNKEWIKIKISSDEYVGWIESKSILTIDSEEYEILSNNNFCINLPTVTATAKSGLSINLPVGAIIPYNINLNGDFSLGEEQFKLDSFEQLTDKTDIDSCINLAENLLNTPYLWGGKTQWGIDCSGLIQILFRCMEIPIPRDASQQVKFGKEVDFEAAKSGDLAFFKNEKGIITHVGLITRAGEIIHASGKVRQDTLDEKGILNSETNTYTHKLTSIRRII